jgi:DNA-binding transcriptional MerR regulator
MANDEKLFYGIGEVAEILQLKAYVLRYWETEFKKLNPQKSFTGQRTYRVRDIQIALTIKKLLYDDQYTIAGAIQKLEELDNKGELVVFPFGSTASVVVPPVETPATPTKTIKPVEAVTEPTVVPTTASTEEVKPVEMNPQMVQKAKDLKGLVEATKKLLKKYNLS